MVKVTFSKFRGDSRFATAAVLADRIPVGEIDREISLGDYRNPGVRYIDSYTVRIPGAGETDLLDERFDVDRHRGPDAALNLVRARIAEVLSAPGALDEATAAWDAERRRYFTARSARVREEVLASQRFAARRDPTQPGWIVEWREPGDTEWGWQPIPGAPVFSAPHTAAGLVRRLDPAIEYRVVERP